MLNVVPNHATKTIDFPDGTKGVMNNELLSSPFFPNVTNLFLWNAFAQGTLADADIIGSAQISLSFHCKTLQLIGQKIRKFQRPKRP